MLNQTPVCYTNWTELHYMKMHFLWELSANMERERYRQMANENENESEKQKEKHGMQTEY